MRFLFITSRRDSSSTVLNAELLAGLNEIEGVSIDLFEPRSGDPYDVVLLMGEDANPAETRLMHPHALIGVIDPRPAFNLSFGQVDFILANGMEMRDWYLRHCPHIYVYYIYPVLGCRAPRVRNTDKIVLGYHGNKIHLMEMFGRITPAINKLAEDVPVEVWAMYNVSDLGRWETGLPEASVKVRHIPWARENYELFMDKTDIGIVPSVVPALPPRAGWTLKRRFNAQESDYYLRFKVTTNPGRLLVFAQLGIPAVCDLVPSNLEFVTNGESGYCCHSTEAWLEALRSLARSPELRLRCASGLQSRFERACPQRLNRGLVDLVTTLSEIEGKRRNVSGGTAG